MQQGHVDWESNFGTPMLKPRLHPVSRTNTVHMKVCWIISAIFLVTAWYVEAQPHSAHAHHQAWFGSTAFTSEAEYDKAQGIRHPQQHPISKNCILQRHQVYGWHPAWSGTAYQDYDFALLSTVGYFSYVVDPQSGSYTTLHQWRETGLVDMAHHSGAQVELTATLFGSGTGVLLRNPKACKTLCDSLLALVREKDADGVCIDFEGMAGDIRVPFANFMDSLSAALHGWRKTATLSITLPAVDRTHAFDIGRLARSVNRFIVMGYDYHWSGSAQAGPVAPLDSSRWGNESLETSLRYYLDAGVPRAKLLAAVPYYGYEWPTQADTARSSTTGKGKAVLLREYTAMDSSAFLRWDSASTTGWLLRSSQKPYRQLWVDQVSSLREKYALVKAMDIGGIGIWALGYDHGSTTYWDLIRSQFADCGATDPDRLAQDSKPQVPGLEGPTSAERNVWNWVWMIAGGIVAVAIIWVVKKYL